MKLHRLTKRGAARGSSGRRTVRSVERALNILVCLADEELRLVDLAKKLQLHKATVSRLLTTLARAGRGMVARNGEDRYGLGPGAILLARPFLARCRMLVDFVRQPLKRIWEKTRETVTVHVRVGLDRVCIEEIESPDAIIYRAGVGSRVPLHAGAAGKVQLAFLPETERAAILKQLKLARLTERTITNRQRLIEELNRIRRVGYATSVGERLAGVAAVSVPVFDRDGRLVAAVSVLGPEARLPAKTLKRYAILLKSEIQPLPLAVQDFGLPEGGDMPRSDTADREAAGPGGTATLKLA